MKNEFENNITTHQKKFNGSEYNAALYDFSTHLQDMRHLNSFYSLNISKEKQKDIENRKSLVRSKIKGDISSIAQLNTHYGKQLEVGLQWKAIRSEYEFLDKNRTSLPKDEYFYKSTQLIRQVIDLMNFVAGTSTLLLEEYSSHYHLVDLNVHIIPETVENLSAARALTSKILSLSNLDDKIDANHKYEFEIILNTINSNMKRFNRTMQYLFLYNKEYRKKILNNYKKIINFHETLPKVIDDVFESNNKNKLYVFLESTDIECTSFGKLFDLFTKTLQDGHNQSIQENQSKIFFTNLYAGLFILAIISILLILNRLNIEKAKKEQDILSYQKRMAAILDNTAEGLITINEFGIIESFSKACEKIFGYTAENAIGQNVKMLMPEEFRSKHEDSLRKRDTADETKIFGIDRELVGLRKDGEHFPIEISISEVDLGEKHIFSGIIRDISERKRTENELTSIGRMLDDSLNEVFIFSSETLKFIQVNRGARKNIGYSMNELKNMTPIDIKPEFTQEEFENLVAPLKNGQKEKITFETIHERKDGSTYDVEVHLQMFNYRNEPVFVAINLDVTERKKAEKEIIRSNEELERFAYIASHDLQEPMRIISSFSDILEEEYGEEMGEEARKYMKFMSDSSKRMQKMVSDLLEYSRVGSEEAGYSGFDSTAQTNLALQNLKEAIDQTGAEITFDKLPTICANPLRFCRIIQNLVGNAIKYRAEDKVPKIHISAKEREEDWLFSVRDNGIGIKKEYAEQIFVIFKRLHNKDEYSGTGIGLAVCQKIIEGFGGQIWVESELGKSSTFFFTIPKVERS